MLHRWQGRLAAILVLFMAVAFIATSAVQASPSGASKPILIAKDTEKGKITGTISQWGSDSFSLKVGAVDWKFKYDPKKVMILGKPAVGAKAKVWYKDAGGNKMATKIDAAGKK